MGVSGHVKTGSGGKSPGSRRNAAANRAHHAGNKSSGGGSALRDMGDDDDSGGPIPKPRAKKFVPNESDKVMVPSPYRDGGIRTHALCNLCGRREDKPRTYRNWICPYCERDA